MAARSFSHWRPQSCFGYARFVSTTAQGAAKIRWVSPLVRDGYAMPTESVHSRVFYDQLDQSDFGWHTRLNTCGTLPPLRASGDRNRLLLHNVNP
jgi:hypothetical protein